MRAAAILVGIILALAATAAATPEGIPITYMDRRGRLPMTTGERLEALPLRGPYERTVVSPVESGTDDELVVLLVDASVSSGISAALATYQSDLEAEGYDVEVWTISGGTATDIRSDLQAEWGSGLVGAVAIGNIPTGWMDGGYGEYPVDVYLMDMNGSWSDPDSDGLFESATNEGPEIWLGRLTPDYLTFGDPVQLLCDYFAKNHAYRSGTLPLPDRALAYEEAFTGLTGYLDLLYGTVVRKTDPAGTNADDFRSELCSGYEWVHLISHSSPWGSSFHDGGSGGTLDNFEVPPLDPQAHFYVLNCCSNGRWTEVDNLANSYIWCESYGLAALAQTKVDYTNDFQEYYTALAGGDCLGEAFIEWLDDNMYYEDGAVLFGDPTLRPRIRSVASGLPGGGGDGGGRDPWLAVPISDGLHTQGRVDTWSDPSTGEVFAVSGSSDPVRANIIATRSDGDTWMQPVTVCQHEYWDWHPTVGGDGEGRVWTAWQSMRDNLEGYDIYVSEWTGSSWGAASSLTSGDPYEVQPAMDGGGGRAWLVWQRWAGGSTDIEGRMWTGSTWTWLQDVSTEEGHERYPDVARGESGFGLTYHAEREGRWVVCFRDAPDSGPFGPETIVSDQSADGRYASLAASGDEYWVAWQSDGAILCSHGEGSTWSAPENISLGCPLFCARPALAASPGGEVTVMWTSGSSLYANVWNGSSWSGAQSVVTADAVDDASLSWSGSELWAVYGRRGTDLQWDLWACRPDPAGIETAGGGIPRPLYVEPAGTNPSMGPVSVEITASGPVDVRVHDLSGRLLGRLEGQSSGLLRLGMLDDSPGGVYFVTVRGEEGERASCRLVRI